MKRFLLHCAVQSQTYRVTRRWYSDRVAIVTYHGLTDDPAPPGIRNYHAKHVLAGTFRRHLEYLARHHTVVSLDQIVDHYERGTRLPPRAVALTFDDGYQSVYRLGFPLLQEFGLPAAFFLATDFVAHRDWLWTDRLEYAIDTTTAAVLELDLGEGPRRFDLGDRRSRMATEGRIRSRLKALPQDALHDAVGRIEDRLDARLGQAADPPALYRPVEWPEVDEMVRSGLVSIGSHTASHVILGRCSDARIVRELVTSREVIERHVSTPCHLFCYPNGKPGCFDARTRALLQQAGYRCGLTTVEGTNGEDADLFELKRLAVVDGGQIDRYRLTLSGMMTHIDAVQTSARRLVSRARAGSPT